MKADNKKPADENSAGFFMSEAEEITSPTAFG